MYIPKNKESKCTFNSKSEKRENSINNNDDNQVDKKALEIFERIYHKYEYVFQELAK